MTVAELEKRLTAVEHELALLRQRGATPHPAEALERIHGTFENDGAFKEAMRLGQKWRRSQGSGQRGSARSKRK